MVSSTHVTARAVYALLRRGSARADLMRFLRVGRDESLGLLAVHEETERLLGELRGLAAAGRIRLAPGLATDPAEDVVADGLRHFAIYHQRPAVMRVGDRAVATDRNLILYYQNRLEGYGLDASAAIRPTLSADHRAIAGAA